MKKKQTIYDRDFKVMAVLLSYKKDSITQTEKEIGIPSSLLNRWRQDYEKYGEGSFPGSGHLRFTPLQKKMHLLNEQLEKARLHADIIKNAVPCLRNGRKAVYQYIQKNESRCSAKQICSILSVDQRAYSRWKNHHITERQKKKMALQKLITDLFYEKEKRYGYMRIAKELQNLGHTISNSTAARYMKELNLSVPIKKP